MIDYEKSNNRTTLALSDNWSLELFFGLFFKVAVLHRFYCNHRYVYVFFTGLDDLVSKIVDEDSSLFAFNGTNNNSCDTANSSELDTFLLDR